MRRGFIHSTIILTLCIFFAICIMSGCGGGGGGGPYDPTPDPTAPVTPTVTPTVSPSPDPTQSPIPTGNVAGKVLDDISSAPVAGARVSIVTNDEIYLSKQEYSDTTKTDGSYLIKNVPEGQHSMTISRTGYEDKTKAVSVQAGQTITEDIKIDPKPEAGNVEGTVTDSVSANPVAGATVSIGGLSSNTDALGKYNLNNIDAGEQTITVTHPSYQNYNSTVTITSGNTVTRDIQIIRILGTGSVSGIIRDRATNMGVEGIEVRIGANKTISGVGGNYTLNDIPEGLQTIYITSFYYSDGQDTVTIIPDDTVSKNIFADKRTWSVTNLVQGMGVTDLNYSQLSMALDNNGNPCISYYKNLAGFYDLRYAHYNGTNWTTEILVDKATANIGRYNSLAFDANGYPCISYYDAVGLDLRFARYNGTKWNAQSVDTPGDVGMFSSLAFSPEGVPYIAYYDNTNKNLKIAYSTGDPMNPWEIGFVDESLTNDVGQYCTLKFNPQGRPCIAYYDLTATALKYAVFNGVTWQKSVIDGLSSSAGTHNSLAFNQNGHPCITYLEIAAARNLKYIEFDGDAWSIPVTVDTTAATNGTRYSSLVFDKYGRPCISYCFYLTTTTQNELRFARFTESSTWQIDRVIPYAATTRSGISSNLAVKADGTPCIATNDIVSVGGDNGRLLFTEFK